MRRAVKLFIQTIHEFFARLTAPHPGKRREPRVRPQVQELEAHNAPGDLAGNAVFAAFFNADLTESTSVLVSVIGDFSAGGTSKSQTASETATKTPEPEKADSPLFTEFLGGMRVSSEQRRATPSESPTVTGAAAITSVDNLFLYGDAFDTPSFTPYFVPLTTNHTDAVGMPDKDGTPNTINPPPVGDAGPAIGAIAEFAADEPGITASSPHSSSPPPPTGGGGGMTMSMTSGPTVVISEIYGGGGTTSNPPYNRDFIELYNRGTTTFDLTGMSVQYSAALGSSWQVTTLSGTIDPGEYFLIGQSSTAGAQGAALPTVDVQGTINMSQSAGKVALVSNTTALVGTASSGGNIVDFVGYGNANAYEGSAPAAQLTSQVSATRRVGGRQDTDQNSVDFSVDTPSPRNNAGQGVNRVPVAVNDTLTLNEDAGATTVDVLANDTDADIDGLTVTSASGASNGTVAVSADGFSAVYTPNTHFNGTDAFSYTISDGFGGTATATVNLTVNAVNDAPVASVDVAVTDENTPVTFNVLANDRDPDNDPLTLQQITLQPAHGNLLVNSSGTLTCTPNANSILANVGHGFFGTDVFAYKISDGQSVSETVVYITVHAVNHSAPIGENDFYTTAVNTPLVVSGLGVLANDAALDGDTLEVVLEEGPEHGELILNANGTFAFTPAVGYTGHDKFRYLAVDGAVTSTLVTVFLGIGTGAPAEPPPALGVVNIRDGDRLLAKFIAVSHGDQIEAVLNTNAVPGMTLDRAAAALGGHHFNWYQVVTKTNRPAWDAEGGDLLAIPETTDEHLPWIDQPAGGFGGVITLGANKVWADKLPWYYLEKNKPAEVTLPTPKHWTSKLVGGDVAMMFSDKPTWPAPNTFAEFKTWLVVVDERGQFVRALQGFSWKSSNPQNLAKGQITDLQYIDPFDTTFESLAENYGDIAGRMGFDHRLD